MNNESRLFVGNLSYQTMENDLQEYFSQAGVVSSVNLMLDKFTGKSRGFAFVEYGSNDEANKAVEMFHNKVVQAPVLAEVEGAYHAGMLELERQAGFALEAGHHFGVLRPRGGQHLDGDGLALEVQRLVDACHAALADAVEDLVLVDEKVIRPALLKQLDLVLGQVLSGDQPAREIG